MWSCFWGQLYARVFKKSFEENLQLSVTDKKALKDDVQDIRWLYTLKPATINIPRYIDEQRDYPEIAILLVLLVSSVRYKRIAAFMQRAIPYPLILLFAYEESIALTLADKRINQADKKKLVVETSFETEWISLRNPNAVQRQFLEDISIKNLSFLHFYALYQDFCARIVALNCANYSGQYVVQLGEEATPQNRVQRLREVQKLEQTQAELRNRLKKETQLARQVALNSEIHHIAMQVKQIKDAL